MRGYRAVGPQNNRSGASPNAVCLFLYLEHPPNAVNIISYHIISPLLVSAAMKRPAKSGSSGSRAPGAASSFQMLKGRLEEEERQRKKEERKRKELEKAYIDQPQDDPSRLKECGRCGLPTPNYRCIYCMDLTCDQCRSQGFNACCVDQNETAIPCELSTLYSPLCIA